jgi:hypothetical protein
MPDEKWLGQKRTVPIGTPPKGFYYDPEVKESANQHAPSINDAIKFFIQNPEIIGKPASIDVPKRSVELDNGRHVSFEDIMTAYQDQVTKTSEQGFFDSPTDVGKAPKGDFPSVKWLPRGQEDAEENPNTTMAKCRLSRFDKRAYEEALPLDYEKQIAAKWGPEYISALYHYKTATENGHDKTRALQYAVAEMKKVGVTVIPEKVLEVANIYMKLAQ